MHLHEKNKMRKRPESTGSDNDDNSKGINIKVASVYGYGNVGENNIH